MRFPARDSEYAIPRLDRLALGPPTSAKSPIRQPRSSACQSDASAAAATGLISSPRNLSDHALLREGPASGRQSQHVVAFIDEPLADRKPNRGDR